MLLEMFRLWKVGEMTLQVSLFFKEANVFFSTEHLNKTSTFAFFACQIHQLSPSALLVIFFSLMSAETALNSTNKKKMLSECRGFVFASRLVLNLYSVLLWVRLCTCS